MNFVYIDFEFNRTQEPIVNLVSATLYANKELPGFLGVKPVNIWLHNDKQKQLYLHELLEVGRDQYDIMIVAFGAAAECRSFTALGLDPHSFKWVDLYAEWRQLTHNLNKCEYGTYYKSGFKCFSVPPKYDPKKNIGKDNTKIKYGYAAAVGQLLEICIDTKHKTQMRNLIIEDRPVYTTAEQEQIMLYCESDTLHLPAIHNKMARILMKEANADAQTVLQWQIRRGSYIASVAKMERVGFPILTQLLLNLRANYKEAQDVLIGICNAVYPFYTKQKKRVSDIGGTWTEKYDSFYKYVESTGRPYTKTITVQGEQVEYTGNTAVDDWPKTEKGALSSSEETLKNHKHLPGIAAYLECKKNITQIGWFKEKTEKQIKEKGDFFKKIGSDHRLRAFLGAFGTQTGRNAPRATEFVLAMSSWLRCVINPPEGYCIGAIDYGSQEFAIAAMMSGDKQMMAAYKSGDPYLYFAKKAGAVPEAADPKLCKNPAKLLKGQDIADIYHPTEKELDNLAPDLHSEYADHLRYKWQRMLFKATTLGLQFGMGATGLAKKLTADMGRKYSEKEAEKLINMHKKLYKKFWSWIEKEYTKYKRRGRITLWDGWTLLCDNDNGLSVKNFPVQGTGAVIMREAVRLAHEKHLDIMAPLHDAIYLLMREDRAEADMQTLADCMNQAVINVVGDALTIRLDKDVHKHGEPWIEEKGEYYYKKLHKYLEPPKFSGRNALTGPYKK